MRQDYPRRSGGTGQKSMGQESKDQSDDGKGFTHG
jgi:hypothetical protein